MAESACDQPAGTVGEASDCDDADGGVHPGAAETCDTVDEDCDGDVDEDAVDRALFTADADADGFGDAAVAELACDALPGWILLGASDCDDGAAGVYPGAEETCDGEDDDCDGVVDEPDASDAPTWYADSDGDGWGDPDDAAIACEQPEGYAPSTCPGGVATWYADGDGDGAGDPDAAESACGAPAGFVAVGGDCDDTNAAVVPAGIETCNGIDDDCDGTVDLLEECIVYTAYTSDTPVDWFLAATDCEARGQHLVTIGDEEELASLQALDVGPTAYWMGAARPSFESLVRQVDGYAGEDWTWTTDEAWSFTAWADGVPAADAACGAVELGGAGWLGLPCHAEVYGWICEDDGLLPVDFDGDGSTWAGGDCDDRTPYIGPHLAEVCDGFDDDCDGLVDEDFGVVGSHWYLDGDGDGVGQFEVSLHTCEPPPAGLVSAYGDCDDADANVGPEAPEVCNGADDDCDGAIDEGGSWWVDGDGDGFGDPATASAACGSGLQVSNGDDCDDADPAVNPTNVWYADLDGDGFGDPAAPSAACENPAGAVADASDCDDGDAFVSPASHEACNAIDDDCDGAVDDDPTCSWYEARTSVAPVDWFTAAADCEAIGLHLATVSDADELSIFATFAGDSTRFWVGGARPVWETELAQLPGYVAEAWTWTTSEPWGFADWAPGEPSNGDDELCLAVEAGGEGGFDLPCDADLHAWICEDDGLAATDQDGDGATWGTGDCDDRSAYFGPSATEVCDGFDDDCDGAVDEGFGTVGVHYYLDADGDGTGVFDLAIHTCDAPPADMVTTHGDCDDLDAAVGPHATETCDGDDDDCDGLVDEGCP